MHSLEELGAAQPLAPDGFIDVTAPPFSADKTGATDDTAAIQRAIDYAKWNYYSVWLRDAAPNVTIAPDEFGELACVPTRSHTLRHNGFLTPPLEHPVLYKSE